MMRLVRIQGYGEPINRLIPEYFHCSPFYVVVIILRIILRHRLKTADTLVTTMAHLNTSPSQLASVAVFCPQSKAPQESYLDQLQSFFARHSFFDKFRQDVVDLVNVWKTVAEQREDIAALPQGPRYMQGLAEWIMDGKSGPVSNSMSGIITLPLLVIMQIGQYFQYLEIQGIKHSEFIASLRKGGGVQGYCGGLPPAIALACSKDEKEVLENAAIAMRIAMAIGAYGELGDDPSIPGATTLVVRTKRPGQADEMVSKFPGVSLLSYINSRVKRSKVVLIRPSLIFLQ